MGQGSRDDGQNPISRRRDDLITCLYCSSLMVFTVVRTRPTFDYWVKSGSINCLMLARIHRGNGEGVHVLLLDKESC